MEVHGKKISPGTTLSTIDPAHASVGLNPDLRGSSPTNRTDTTQGPQWHVNSDHENFELALRYLLHATHVTVINMAVSHRNKLYFI